MFSGLLPIVVTPRGLVQVIRQWTTTNQVGIWNRTLHFSLSKHALMYRPVYVLICVLATAFFIASALELRASAKEERTAQNYQAAAGLQ